MVDIQPMHALGSLMWFRVLVLGGVMGCSAGAEQMTPERSVADGRSQRVEVVVVEPSNATVDMTLPGEVRGARDARLAAALGGYVERVHVSEGEEVRKGAPLLSVDAEVHGASLDRATALLEQAQRRLAEVEALGDMASKAQIEDAKVGARVAEAAIRQARAQYARARVVAPFPGVVASVSVEEGEVVPPAGPVARLVQLDPVKVSLSVPDRDVVALSAGMPVQVSTPAVADILRGKVLEIPAAASTRTRTFLVDVEVPNPDRRLLPGMIAQVTVRGDIEQGAVVIPQDWVVTGLQGPGVFIETDGVAHWQAVTLGRVTYDQVVVTDGVSFGDRVVVLGHRDLVDGDAVLVTREGRCCATGRPVF